MREAFNTMDFMKPGPSHEEREKLHNDIERMRHVLRAETGFSDDDDEEDDFQEDSEDDSQWYDSQAAVGGDPGDPGPSTSGLSTSFAHDALISLKAEEGEEKEEEEQGNFPETCLHLNKLYQETLTDYISKVELVLAGNRERQAHLKSLLEQQGQNRVNKPKKRGLCTYSIPYFKDINGMMPPPNEDAQVKQALLEQQPYINPARMWTRKEIIRLEAAVKEDSYERKTRSLLNKRAVAEEKLNNAVLKEEQSELEEFIKEIDESIKQVKNLPFEELCGEPGEAERVDWMKISNKDFAGVRTAEECEVIWKNAFHPSINRHRWTPDEEEQLMAVGREYNFVNWQKISEELGTNRTAFQCLQRYQTKLNPCLSTGKWSKEENSFLETVIEKCRIGDNIPWNEVAYYMEGRSREQCVTRWKVLQKCRQPFTAKEDQLLLEAVQRLGADRWVPISRHVPGRSAAQCRERYINRLKGNIKNGPWNLKEDKLLLQAVRMFGTGNWVKIATCVPGRSDNQCLQRYRRIQRWERENSSLMEVLDENDLLVMQKPEVAEQILEIDKEIHAVESQIQTLEQEWKAVGYSETLTLLSIPEDSKEHDVKKLRTKLKHLKLEKLEVKEKALSSSMKEDREFLMAPTISMLRANNIHRPGQVLATHIRNKEGMISKVKKKVIRAVYGRGRPAQQFLGALNRMLPGGTQEDEKVKEAIQSLYLRPIKQQMSEVVQVVLAQFQQGRWSAAGGTVREENKLDAELRRLLCSRDIDATTTKGRGRPRLFGGDVAGPSRVNPSDSTVQSVSSLFLEALKVNKKDVANVAESQRKALQIKHKYLRQELKQQQKKAPHQRQPSSSAASSSSSCSSSQRAAVKMEYLENEDAEAGTSSTRADDDAEDEDDAEEDAEVPQPSATKRRRQRYKYRDAGCLLRKSKHLIESSDSLALAEPEVACCLQLMSGLTKDRPETEKRDLKSARVILRNTRYLVGSAAEKYVLAPLPPSNATLAAFKSLLLNRRGLVQNAKNFKIVPFDADANEKTQTQIQGKDSGSANLGSNVIDLTSAPEAGRGQSKAGRQTHMVLVLPDETEKIIPVLDSPDISTEKEAPPGLADTFQPVAPARNPPNGAGNFTDQPMESQPIGSFSADENLRKVLSNIHKTHAFQLLNARMAAIFLWPALLSTISVKQFVEKKKPTAEVKKKKKKKLPATKKKRKRKASAEPDTEEPVAKRRPGRPKGTCNKPKVAGPKRQRFRDAPLRRAALGLQTHQESFGPEDFEENT